MKAHGVKERGGDSCFFIGAILVITALVRLVFLFQSYDDPYLLNRFADEDSFHQWAHQIMEGNYFRERAFFTSPLYAYFLALFYTFFSDDLLIF